MKRTTTSISTQPLNKAVFLDRDGNDQFDEGHYYIYKPEDFVIQSGSHRRLETSSESRLSFDRHHQSGGIAKGYIPGKICSKYTRKDVC